MTRTADKNHYPPGLARPGGRNAALRRALAGPGLVLAPGAYDCITARLVERAGFDALYVTGSGVSMSRLGAPDVGLMSATEVVDQVQRIADVVSIPVIADADTGFGGPLNVVRIVRDMERAGVSAIQIEDQAWPKRCGHEPGRRLVPVGEMVSRLKAALDARQDPDLIIIARTDARSDFGLDAALERAAAYGDAGADVIFVESPESEDELRRVPAALNTPALANMVEGGRTPILAADRLAQLGYRIVIYPNALTRLFAQAGAEMLADLKSAGSTEAWRGRMLDHRGLWELFDYDRWTGLEAGLNAAGDDGA